MKKLISLSLILLAVASFAFAEDAKVMPMMVGRVYVAPTYGFMLGAYDTDGDFSKFSETSQLFNLGFAVEYGIINWITAAVQWAPGWTLWSDVGGAMDGAKAGSLVPLNTDKANSNGLADIFVGAKIQIVGEQAPVQNSMFRAAIAPGVIIPLPGADFDGAFDKLAAGDKVTVQNMDNHVFAAGARLYFDWVINENFFINLYNETIFYPLKKDLADAGAEMDVMKGNLNYLSIPTDTFDGEKNYKYQLIFELEPVFTTSLSEGISLSAGLPVNYKYNPAPDYSLSGFETADAILEGMSQPKASTQLMGSLNTDPAHALSVKPNVSIFLTSTPLPLEFKLQYAIPVWGKNSMATHTITFQARVYFALPGRPE